MEISLKNIGTLLWALLWLYGLFFDPLADIPGLNGQKNLPIPGAVKLLGFLICSLITFGIWYYDNIPRQKTEVK